MPELVWVAMNLDDGNRIVYSGSKQGAMRVAAALVGNNSYSRPVGDICLFGPGDGTTSVMVRQAHAKCVADERAYARIGSELLSALRAIGQGLSVGEDGLWRAGPWADPSSPDGQGGVVERLRAVLAKAAHENL